ncbi:hypothetical protein IWW37_003394 [Coemansia sp. RSA 2050]|nr:hypothetical protein IWW37_003394 [Coemansia sp. RSA 2050]
MHLLPSDQESTITDMDSTATDSGHTPAPAIPSPPDSTAQPAATPTKSSSKQAQRKRARATTEQVAVLESVFMVNRSPASRLREDLAARLGMAPRQVQVWFQNRRAKEKTQQRNPRPLQHHPNLLFDQLAYPSVSPDYYSMAATASFLPIGVDPTSTTGTPVVAQPHHQLQNQCQNPLQHPRQHQQQIPPQQNYLHHGILDNQMALAAASTTTANPWMNWNMDMPYQSHVSPSLAQYYAMSEPHAMPPPGPVVANTVLKMASSTASAASMYAANITDSRRESEASAITAVASSPSTSDHVAVAPGSTAITAAAPAASALNAGADATSSAPTAGHPVQLSHKGSSQSLLFSQPMMSAEPLGTAPAPVLPDTGSSAAIGLAHAARLSRPALMPDPSSASVTYPGCTAPPPGARPNSSARRPAPLSLISGHNGMPAANMPLSGASVNSGTPAAATAISGNGMLAHPGMHPGFHLGGLNLGVGLSMGMGYTSYIPEIPSYMVLDASQLVVGSWQRVPMPDTELTCLACVEPPPLKPVQRPGNHRPTELDSLVGEFQWIIGSCGGRYKMVLPYTAICRIKFREIPDRAASLLDTASDSVVNTPAALSLLNSALKNPQAQGELSIHVYDLPTYYFQTESGGWTKIDDFSENMSASKTNVHTVSGSFVSLYHQLRTLLATCSRLKSAADALMALWMGSMDDPYSAIAGIPHNTWIPCAETVVLHAPKFVSSQPAATVATTEPVNSTSGGAHGSADKAATPATLNMCVPASAASSAISTLTPTPTSASCPQIPLPLSAIPPALGSARNAVFTFNDVPQPTYHSSIAAAMTAAGPGGVAPLPLKTQRSASLPFIRLAANGAHAATGKVNPSSSLCRTIDGESVSPIEASGDILSQPSGSNEANGGNASAAVGALAGLGISNTQPLPLRHRMSCNHLRRPAPYQVAPPTGSSWANSPQMSPSPFWHAHSLRRASRDSLSGHHHSHSTLGSAAMPTTPLSITGPPCSFIRRESDAELALAMNHAFVNGDVLGAHRGIGDLYGGSGVPPSPLSNMTMAACPSAMQVDSEAANDPAGDNNGASCGLAVPHSGVSADVATKLASQQSGMSGPSLLPPNEVYGPTSKSYGVAASEGMGMNMSNAEIVMAIFNAMSNAATTASVEDIGRAFRFGDGQSMAAAAPSVSAELRAAGMFDPTSFGYDPGAFMHSNDNNSSAKIQAAGGGPHAMDWCFDWSHAAPCGLSEAVPELVSTVAANGLGAGKGDGEMCVDWASSGDSGTVADSACPSSLAFGTM